MNVQVIIPLIILSYFLLCSLVLSPLPSPEDVLGALRGVIGRRHPSTAQSRQLKHTLPTLSVVLELLLSQVAQTLWLDFKVLMLSPALFTNPFTD